MARNHHSLSLCLCVVFNFFGVALYLQHIYYFFQLFSWKTTLFFLTKSYNTHTGPVYKDSRKWTFNEDVPICRCRTSIDKKRKLHQRVQNIHPHEKEVTIKIKLNAVFFVNPDFQYLLRIKSGQYIAMHHWMGI